MSEAELYFGAVGEVIADAKRGNMFGKPCFKINNKAFVCFFQACMVFKLRDEAHRDALSLPESVLFDPSGKNRPMKEWVQVSFQEKDLWERFAEEAVKYVREK
ncbi:MAG TPA: hypothetical protein ENJ82_03760 [Bacteroidetes bacterium]|nr:hypothetical protein [Bacteroidota bacterium]